MSDTAELARGVILTGFDGERAPDTLAQFAGCILFARNGTSVAAAPRASTDASSEAAYSPAAVPPLIGIDQEGGRVARLQTGIETVPSMMALRRYPGRSRSRRARRRADGVRPCAAPAQPWTLLQCSTSLSIRQTR